MISTSTLKRVSTSRAFKSFPPISSVGSIAARGSDGMVKGPGKAGAGLLILGASARAGSVKSADIKSPYASTGARRHMIIGRTFSQDGASYRE